MNTSYCVERALSNPAPLKLENGSWVSDSSVYQAAGVEIPSLAGHDYPVIFPSRDELNLPDCYVPAESLDELRVAVYAYYKVTNILVDLGSVKTIEFLIKHEGQHADAAIALGAVQNLYAIRISRHERQSMTSWEPCHFPVSLKTTRAGIAAMTAFPEFISPGDSLQIDKLRYRSVSHVGNVAESYGLPIPLSIQRGLRILAK